MDLNSLKNYDYIIRHKNGKYYICMDNNGKLFSGWRNSLKEALEEFRKKIQNDKRDNKV